MAHDRILTKSLEHIYIYESDRRFHPEYTFSVCMFLENQILGSVRTASYELSYRKSMLLFTTTGGPVAQLVESMMPGTSRS